MIYKITKSGASKKWYNSLLRKELYSPSVSDMSLWRRYIILLCKIVICSLKASVIKKKKQPAGGCFFLYERWNYLTSTSAPAALSSAASFSASSQECLPWWSWGKSGEILSILKTKAANVLNKLNNQAKHIGELAHQYASAGCSVAARHRRAKCVARGHAVDSRHIGV